MSLALTPATRDALARWGDHLSALDGAPVNTVGTTTTKEFVVSGGQITLDTAFTVGGCVGLPYRGRRSIK